MAQTTQLINALKKALKAHGKTYADTARYLDISEASVKRGFSQKNFSLQRLDRICQMIDIEFTDLLQMLKDSAAAPISGLSMEHEKEIVSDIELLLITVCVLNRWTLQQILDHFNLDELGCIRHLIRLDRLKMIELLPNNRVKLLLAPNFQWLENGPIQQFFQKKLQSDFFDSGFAAENENLIVINGMLASSSFSVFQRKMEHLAKEFTELSNDDAGLPLEERSGMTAVLAMRPWGSGIFGEFKKYRRKQ
jgi:transcriptional regulator with XRE-family HTH domain